MGLFDNFFSSNTEFKQPGMIKKPQQDISLAVQKMMGVPYTPYKGQMTAGTTATQDDALTYLRSLIPGRGRDEFTTPRLIDNIPGTGRGGGTIQDYMNPNIQATLDPALRAIREQTETSLNADDARAHFSGGFRDAGHAFERSQDKALGTQAIGDTTARGYSDAFNQAMSARNLDINRLMENRSGQIDAAGKAFDMGTAKQETNQRALTAKYAEFLRKIGYDEDKVAKMANIIASLSSGTPQTTPSTASSLLGAGSSIASLFV